MRRHGRSGADPGPHVCLFVCLCVCPGWVGGGAGGEFRGKDRTKRFRRASSTKSQREVESDSLILGVWAPFCVDFGGRSALLGPAPPDLLSLAALRAVGDLIAAFSHQGCEAA